MKHFDYYDFLTSFMLLLFCRWIFFTIIILLLISNHFILIAFQIRYFQYYHLITRFILSIDLLLDKTFSMLLFDILFDSISLLLVFLLNIFNTIILLLFLIIIVFYFFSIKHFQNYYCFIISFAPSTYWWVLDDAFSLWFQ